MPLSTYTVRMDGWALDILRDGHVVGHGRWTGDGIADATLVVHPGDPEREAALHRQWVRSINADIDAALAAAPPTHNAEGVDLSLLDWMLSLTPIERLDVLQEWLATFGQFVEEAS